MFTFQTMCGWSEGNRFEGFYQRVSWRSPSQHGLRKLECRTQTAGVVFLPAKPGIYTFTEDRLIGDSQEHSMKIRNCLGSAALAELADKPAIHSAVSLGTSSFAIGYARQMSEGLVSPAFQACEAAGVDAGLHDYLLHSEGAEGVQTFDQASGLVADVQVWSARYWALL